MGREVEGERGKERERAEVVEERARGVVEREVRKEWRRRGRLVQRGRKW